MSSEVVPELLLVRIPRTSHRLLDLLRCVRRRGNAPLPGDEQDRTSRLSNRDRGRDVAREEQGLECYRVRLIAAYDVVESTVKLDEHFRRRPSCRSDQASVRQPQTGALLEDRPSAVAGPWIDAKHAHVHSPCGHSPSTEEMSLQFAHSDRCAATERIHQGWQQLSDRAESLTSARSSQPDDERVTVATRSAVARAQRRPARHGLRPQRRTDADHGISLPAEPHCRVSDRRQTLFEQDNVWPERAAVFGTERNPAAIGEFDPVRGRDLAGACETRHGTPASVNLKHDGGACDLVESVDVLCDDRIQPVRLEVDERGVTYVWTGTLRRLQTPPKERPEPGRICMKGRERPAVIGSASVQIPC